MIYTITAVSDQDFSIFGAKFGRNKNCGVIRNIKLSSGKINQR